MKAYIDLLIRSQLRKAILTARCTVHGQHIIFDLDVVSSNSAGAL